ncbi:MAG: ATP-binding protein [Nitrospiraceae bacterium]|nr:ATP-binding protein [Nitrospiraceae bacterium]
MSLQKKIILGFLISSVIIALLSVFLFLNFVEIKKETGFLEMTDTIRSKSLQLRRHEKNYFLYAPEKASAESAAIYQYLGELDEIVNTLRPGRPDRTHALKGLVQEYREKFGSIERLMEVAADESGRLSRSLPAYARVSRLIVSNFLDKPLEDVAYLQENFSLEQDHRLIQALRELDVEIAAIRKTGESILAVSKELDKSARDNVDSFIHLSRIAILVFFPLFLIVGFGTILYTVSNVVKRLKLVTAVIERTGTGNYAHVAEPADAWGRDELGQLIHQFNVMEEQLEQREKELLQSKKLAAIGTLASGVAHELNNPLNNIYTTAQRLKRKTGPDAPEHISKGLDDIFAQTMRVKRIVGDLLSFARGRDPHLRPVELKTFMQGVYKQVANTVNLEKVSFTIRLVPEEIVMYADPEQLEQVFINLFTNAVESMEGAGGLTVGGVEEDRHVKITVSDTGRGMSAETAEKIFEPFFSTKDKGTGLGLAIVFNIIKRHHGDIEVQSAEGKGTTFIITLPKNNGVKENAAGMVEGSAQAAVH